MAYDEALAARIRDALAGVPDVVEKRMFGGLAFIVQGNMAVGASGQGGLLLRVDPADADTLEQEPGVDEFEMRGRGMPGWLRVAPEAAEGEAALQRWVDIGVARARALPPK